MKLWASAVRIPAPCDSAIHQAYLAALEDERKSAAELSQLSDSQDSRSEIREEQPAAASRAEERTVALMGNQPGMSYDQLAAMSTEGPPGQVQAYLE